MPVFPEHIHIEGEDTLLRRAARGDQYRHLIDGLLALIMVGGVLLIVAILVLMML
jgi:hypothetical protein